jgi:hypothetical protein
MAVVRWTPHNIGLSALKSATVYMARAGDDVVPSLVGMASIQMDGKGMSEWTCVALCFGAGICGGITYSLLCLAFGWFGKCTDWMYRIDDDPSFWKLNAFERRVIEEVRAAVRPMRDSANDEP